MKMKWNDKCSDLKSIQKTTRSRLSPTHLKDTDNIHEVCWFVQLVYEAGGSPVVEVTCEDVATGEVRSD